MQAQRDDELHRHRQKIRRLQQLLQEQEVHMCNSHMNYISPPQYSIILCCFLQPMLSALSMLSVLVSSVSCCMWCTQTSASQVTLLNEELRSRNKELERTSKRSGANLDYLKNMVVAWMEEDSQEQVFQVIATILQFSPEEMARIKEKRKPQGFRVGAAACGARFHPGGREERGRDWKGR
jgi:hypothetical protein